MSKLKLDHFSRVVYAATDVLFLRNPERTSLGILVGVTLHTLINLFQPLWHTTRWVNPSLVGIWEWIVLGIVVLHLPGLPRLFRRDYELGESVERALAMIKKAKREGVPEWTIRSMYLQLCEKALENVSGVDEAAIKKAD